MWTLVKAVKWPILKFTYLCFPVFNAQLKSLFILIVHFLSTFLQSNEFVVEHIGALKLWQTVCFFELLDKKFNEGSKKLLKTLIFLLQVCFTSNFVSDCPLGLCFCQFKL